MPFEDMGIMRGIPTMTVIEPTDITMLEELLPQMARIEGVMYMRLVRKDVKKVYEAGSKFEIGKAALLRSGRDVMLIASGYCVPEALAAEELLRQEGIEAGVTDMFTWKPLDADAVLAAAADCGAIVTAENHNVVNGLGSAVAEVLVQHDPVPMEMVGIKDEFGEVGPVSYLRERFGLTAENIAAAARRAVARKAK